MFMQFFKDKNNEDKRWYGLIWGVFTALLGILIADFFQILETITNYLVQGLIWVFLFPLKASSLILSFLGTTNKYGVLILAAVIGFAVWTYAFRFFRFVLDLLKKLNIF